MRKLRTLTSVDDFDRETLESLFDRATYYLDNFGKVEWNILRRKRMLSIYCQPSTRTRFSFEAAMDELGGTTLNSQDALISSSFAKDESIEDGIRVLSEYGHIIVMRHKLPIMRQAADASLVPFISAGEATKEHPTQTLLDLFTIEHERGRIDDLTIGMAGDLVNGRTIHSLAKALAQFYSNVRMVFISPPQLSIPQEIKDFLDQYCIEYTEHSSLAEAPLNEMDCLYVTRIQKEWFEDDRDYQAVKGCCVLRQEYAEAMRDDAIVMHPLPRVDEIPTIIDQNKRARYFLQVRYGLVSRMALLEHMLI
jgi:aspartate carbamoyltransferase catalytic subunit